VKISPVIWDFIWDDAKTPPQMVENNSGSASTLILGDASTIC
jgi:hypothetical protein